MRQATLTLIFVALALGMGCRVIPPQTAGTIRDVAGSLTQTIEQQMGIKPAMLIQYSMAGAFVMFGILLGFMMLLWQARALKSVRVKVVLLMTSLSFVAVGVGIVLRMNGG